MGNHNKSQNTTTNVESCQAFYRDPSYSDFRPHCGNFQVGNWKGPWKCSLKRVSTNEAYALFKDAYSEVWCASLSNTNCLRCWTYFWDSTRKITLYELHFVWTICVNLWTYSPTS